MQKSSRRLAKSGCWNGLRWLAGVHISEAHWGGTSFWATSVNQLPQLAFPATHAGDKKFNSRLLAPTIFLASLFCGSF
jgi:hypothetical protein